MNQSLRTIQFAVLAVASLGIAVATHYAYKPKDLASFSDVGEEFFPDFTDPNSATGLQVASYNAETGQTDIFKVEFKNGLWRIPSHHDYPADAQDRLAKVAASMIGVPRQAMVERTAAAHKRYDLLDPLDKTIDGTEGRGDRITLFQEDRTLVDFIVGKKVEGEEDIFYVRRFGEDRFYTANLGKFEISTKFADWIKKDVLEIDRNNVRQVVVDRYQVDEAKGTIVPQEQFILDRASSTADWTIADLKENEQVKNADVNNMLTALNDLQIAGVRPKPAGMAAGLKGEDSIQIDRIAELDLAEKGIYVHRGQFIGNEGELIVGTGDGVTYVLKFGEEFSGSDVDIEVGKSAAQSPAEETAKTDDPAEKSSAEPKTAGDDSTAEPNADPAKAGKSNRYLLVYTDFNEELLGGPPMPPVKPEPPSAAPAKDQPEGDKPENADPAEKAAPAAADQPADEKPADAQADEKPADADDPAKTSPPAKAEEPRDPQKDYEAALKDYELQLEAHAIQVKEYEEKLKKGRERSDELNRRFADWYYVISEEVFDRLKLSRSELVEIKESEKPETATPSETPTEDKPAAAKPTDEKPKAAPPAEEKPAAENKPEAAKPAGDEPSAEKPQADKPADEKPEPAKPSTESGDGNKGEKPADGDKPAAAPNADPPSPAPSN